VTVLSGKRTRRHKTLRNIHMVSYLCLDKVHTRFKWASLPVWALNCTYISAFLVVTVTGILFTSYITSKT